MAPSHQIGKFWGQLQKVVKIPFYPLFQGEAIVINDVTMVLWELMYLVA
jgi:hypothetical protein